MRIANISETTVSQQLVDEAPLDQVLDAPPKGFAKSAPNDLALRGLASGVVDARLSNKLPCIVFGDSYPSWLAFAGQLGYEPVAVILRSDKFLTAVEASVGDQCVIWCFPDWTPLMERPPGHFADRDAVVLVDGRVTQEILDLAQVFQVHTVLGTGLQRRKVRGWKQVVAKAKHAEAGGVSHSLSHVVACSLEGTPVRNIPQPTLPTSIPRDLGSVLSDVEGSGVNRAPPRQRRLSTFAVVNTRPEQAWPVYHGQGWLPPNPPRSTQVLTPSVFAPKGKWKRRRLTSHEWLAAYDCPDRLLSVLGPHVSDPSFPGLRPGKSLLAAACIALRNLGSNGGGSFISLTTPVLSGQSRQALNSPAMERPLKIRKLEPNEKSDHQEEVESPAQEILKEVDRDVRERKATKSDDAAVPEYLWTEHFIEESEVKSGWQESDKPAIEKGMAILRKYLLRRWKWKVLRSYVDWLHQSGNRPEGSATNWVKLVQVGAEWKFEWRKDGLQEYQSWHRRMKEGDLLEFEAGSDAIFRAWNSTWWEWDDGSRPFHWRWPKWYRNTIRDGLEIHLRSDVPEYKVPQRDEKDPTIKEAIKKKLAKVRYRRYIAKGAVVSLTSFFAVEKGEDDIRMVYDGTKSGLNEAMWVPRFGLPTIESHLRSIEEGTFMADVDVGECFLNFPLHPSLRKLAGVDLTHYFPDPNRATVWECWHRALMGVKSSPYQAVQGMSVAEEVIRGDPSDTTNVFQWDDVRLNCPGDESYDPSKPWVSKVRLDDRIAADLISYVDDLRPSGPSRREAWKAARRTASVLNHLGIQDAARKRRDSSRTPGAWAGSVVVTRDDGVYTTADTEKWKKAKAMVDEVILQIQKCPKRMDRKRLESIRGFLNYVVRTYPPLKPYLTGLHLTIDGWRPNRDVDGWRLKKKKVAAMVEDEDWNWEEGDSDEKGLLTVEEIAAPAVVEAKKRLGEDMVALRYLMSSAKPLPRRVRSKKGRKVVYCFGDASSSGFGITLEVDGTVYYEYGQWNEKAENRSSNWREATNLLEGLRRAVEDHNLHGLELFIFTDNTTAESTFWKGSSSDQALSSVVLEMRKLEMEYDLTLHVIHVSGSRMIKQGTDGLSRADHSNGVMNGEKMSRHVPLNLSAFDRSPQLKQRFDSYFPTLKLKLMKPRDWFDEYHRFGNFVWTPPPAAAEAVVDLLNKARHKRPESMHIVLVPRLMTGRWRRMLTRTSDFYFKMDWSDSWDLKVHHEPLLCFICLPFRVSRPKLRERAQLLDEVGSLLLQPDLRKKSHGERWDLLRKFLVQARSLCTLP
mmetsp:Transcript_18233/g.45137  ORF Transcript_18233/g.45137 Transcript_18233/m.45137 type:complete len:1296 (-) Transcript_18233:2196-6083(-)